MEVFSPIPLPDIHSIDPNTISRKLLVKATTFGVHVIYPKGGGLGGGGSNNNKNIECHEKGIYINPNMNISYSGMNY